MTRFTDRVTRDLHQIADRSTPSSTAWDSIRTRIDEQTDQPPTMEVIMLSPDRNDQPKRGWMLAAAAVAGLALVGGLVFATTRSDDTGPADTPTATLPAEPAPDAEVDPDTDAVVVPAPDPTTAAEVAPEPEPAPEPVTATVTGTFSTEDVVATTAPNSSGLIGDAAWQATTVYEGQMAGTAPGIWQTWDLGAGGEPSGGELRVGEHVFTGTIEGLGSGTLTYTAEWLTVGDIASGKAAITGGTGDFEGAYGSAVLDPVPAAPGDSSAGTYSWDITVPPKGSLVTVTATGTASLLRHPRQRIGEQLDRDRRLLGFDRRPLPRQRIGPGLGRIPCMARSARRAGSSPARSTDSAPARSPTTGSASTAATTRPGSTSSSTARVTSKGSRERDRSLRTGRTPTR